MNFLGRACCDTGASSNVDLLNVMTDILPDTTDLRDIGSGAKRWRDGTFKQMTSDKFINPTAPGSNVLLANGSTLAIGGSPATYQDVYTNSVFPASATTNIYAQDIQFDTPLSTPIMVISGSTGRVGITDLTGGTGNPINVHQDIDLLANDILNAGTVTASSLVKTGGTSSQYLIADGSVLTQSAVSGNANFYLYSFDPVTTGPPIISGTVSCNNATMSSSTIVWLSLTTSDSISIVRFLQQITLLNDFYIQDKASSVNFIQFNITAAPTIFGTYILIPVASSSAGGTGNTNFGVIPVVCSFFINGLEVDTRLSALETKTQNQTAVVNATTFAGAITVPTIDTAASLSLGGTNATAINIGRTGIITTITGTTVNCVSRVNAPIHDRSTAGALSIGTTTNSTSINMGNDAIITTITGASTNVSAQVNAPVHDRATAGALSIGTTANSTSINMGNDAIITTITGASTNASARLNAPVLDRATAGTLSIGTATATAISIGSGAIITTYPSTGGIVATKYNASQPSTSFLKGDGTFDTSTYLTAVTAANSPFVWMTNFVGTADVTVANTTAVTTLWGAGTGSLTLTDVLGQSRKLYVSGKLSLLAGNSVNFRYWPTTVNTVSNFGITPAVTQTNVPWSAEISYTIRGVNTYYCTTKITYGDPGIVALNVNAQTRNLGTFPHDFTVTFSAASASNTITQTEMILYSTYV